MEALEKVIKARFAWHFAMVNDKFLVREAQCGIGTRKVLCYVVGPGLDLIRVNDSSGFV